MLGYLSCLKQKMILFPLLFGGVSQVGRGGVSEMELC